jgi:uncharacterized membrane protein
MAKSTQDTGSSLVSSLRASPVTKRLTEEAVRLLDAHGDRLAGKVNHGVSALGKLTESGELPALGKGAGRLLETGKPVSAAMSAAKSAVTDKAKNLVGGSKGKGTGKAKAMNIEESIDVGVPVSVAYDQWTQFTEFSRFTKAVESVEQVSDTETNWRAKILKSRRTWKATIQEQVPDHRIVWTSEGSKGSTKGVVTFHPLADDLTRVLLAIEYYPVGVVEKTGNIWRAVGRRTRLDLKNFRRFVTMEGEATGSWRGKVEDGKVVSGPDDSGPARRRPRKATSQSTHPRKATQSRSRTASGNKSQSRTASGNKSPARTASSDKSRKEKPSAGARKAQPTKRTSTRRRSGS